jgi:hypothetical protein
MEGKSKERDESVTAAENEQLRVDADGGRRAVGEQAEEGKLEQDLLV